MINFEQVCTLHDDAFVVTLQTAYAKMSCTLVDGEAEVNMVFKDTMERMRLLNEMSCILVDGEAEVNMVFKDTMERMRLLNDITKTRSILKAFERTFVQILGTLKLLVVVGPYSPMINLHVVGALSPHNAILKRN
ncbi:hypothetical protein PS2_015105 [Malus domestica]